MTDGRFHAPLGYAGILDRRGYTVDLNCPICKGRGGMFRAFDDNSPAARKWFDCRCVKPKREATDAAPD